ncbi:MAG: class I SAM-dependent methyltransferase [Desulfobacterales bacterium]|nr:MAG: class I SAM-dependent methyltransferase [Desulfobacterales bacterium]
MTDFDYLMESDDEALRLDLKTDPEVIEKLALWAGIKPGMRIADIGCGSGKAAFYLHKLIQPGGQTIGIDGSDQRLNYAREHYSAEGIEYVCKNLLQPLDDLGRFDFIWLRFILEYFRSKSFDIVKNVSTFLKPGGILCLIDLDCNCLRFFGFGERLEKTVIAIMKALEINADFDPYIGVKLYTYLYDLGFQDLDVLVTPHNLTFGQLNDTAAFNWTKKVEVAAKNSGYTFEDYPGGFEEFFEEFKRAFTDPRRFHYSPLICCKGHKPLK